jgi:Flp pilus assembly protein TadG
MTMSARRRSPGSETGAAFIELAVAVPVLVVLLAGVGDFARIFYYSIELSNAARAGAQYGAASLTNAGSASGMQSTAAGASTNIGLSSSDIATLVTCVCSDDTGSSFTATTGGANNCSAPVTTSCPTAGTHRVLAVTVTATKTFSPIMRVPPLPASMSLTRSATERVSE